MGKLRSPTLHPEAGEEVRVERRPGDGQERRVGPVVEQSLLHQFFRPTSFSNSKGQGQAASAKTLLLSGWAILKVINSNKQCYWKLHYTFKSVRTETSSSEKQSCLLKVLKYVMLVWNNRQSVPAVFWLNFFIDIFNTNLICMYVRVTKH